MGRFRNDFVKCVKARGTVNPMDFVILPVHCTTGDLYQLAAQCHFVDDIYSACGQLRAQGLFQIVKRFLLAGGQVALPVLLPRRLGAEHFSAGEQDGRVKYRRSDGSAFLLRHPFEIAHLHHGAHFEALHGLRVIFIYGAGLCPCVGRFNRYWGSCKPPHIGLGFDDLSQDFVAVCATVFKQ